MTITFQTIDIYDNHLSDYRFLRVIFQIIDIHDSHLSDYRYS